MALLLEEPTAAGCRGPVLVAIDDVQWLDGSSAEALAFALLTVAP